MLVFVLMFVLVFVGVGMGVILGLVVALGLDWLLVYRGFDCSCGRRS